MSIQHKQDMPPKGGHKSIIYKRVPTWSPKSSYLIAGVALLVPLGIWDYRTRKSRNIANVIEEDEGRQSLEPLMQAETDRLVLWQMRRNRDEENELMKDVPGWKTGTWFGESLFKTDPNFDKWVQPTYLEIYPHVRLRDMKKHMNDRHWLN